MVVGNVKIKIYIRNVEVKFIWKCEVLMERWKQTRIPYKIQPDSSITNKLLILPLSNEEVCPFRFDIKTFVNVILSEGPLGRGIKLIISLGNW